MEPELIGGLIGYGTGMVLGEVLFAWIISLITRGIGKVVKKPEWHGWYAGLAVAVLGVFGQLNQGNLIGIVCSSLGALIVWLIAAEKSKAN